MELPDNTAKLSPMMKQYLDIKEKHMDKILFYRLGDFYEMFFDDAITASRELELVLTGRDCGLAERAPMCGIPYHSYENYVAKLIAKGYKVAICEQTEDPALAKGIVKRDIIRIVTPGTVTQNSMLDEEQNNYICCLLKSDGGYGLCFADISTGVVYVTETSPSSSSVINELSRFAPKEIICDEKTNSDKKIRQYIDKSLNLTASLLYNEYFELDRAKQSVTQYFEKKDCAEVLALKSGFAVRALGAMLQYLAETQFHGSRRLASLTVYHPTEYLALSASCRRNLELTATMRGDEKRGSLLWVLDKSKTAMGKRLLRSFLDKPLLNPNQINRRLDTVEELYDNTIMSVQITDVLKGIFDIERLMTRVIYRSCTPHDLISLSATAQKIVELKALCSTAQTSLLQILCDQLDTLEDIKARVDMTISEEPPALLKDGGYIKKGFNSDVDELRGLVNNSKSYLAKMEADLKEQTGIKNLKVGYNRVFGYYIEVSRASNTEKIPDGFVRKQTLTTGERYITEELKELETKILSANERLNVLERQLYEELIVFVESNLKRVQSTAAAIAYIDVLCGFSNIARDNGYCKPLVDGSDVIDIKNGRHPVVEKVLREELFVPNDTHLNCGKNLVNLITGPNMAGKSTYMRQTAIIVLLAQMGCYVPAASAHIGAVDSIFTRVGASDDLFAGDSTFMVEMKEVAEILSNATAKSLVVLDEIGRGTSTFDGMSIARAVIEYICGKNGIGCKTMFATHYHELTVMADEFDNIKNYNIAVKKRGDDITFLRRIVDGPADESYGIEVAKLAGIPNAMIDRAKEILLSIEQKEGVPKQRIQAVKEVSNGSAELLAAVQSINIECLTPIEAMYRLNELKQIASQIIQEEMTANAN
ncbi:MAG: DNA mismatch repair protein MutS [Oscillospiraceae bacterium]